MSILNTRGYDLVDDSSRSGFRRPPRDPACVCDYFAALGYIEDGGSFSHKEMAVLLNHPSEFFSEVPNVPA